MNKKKIIVYGLGKNYKKLEIYIKNKFDVIGYSDTNKTDALTGGVYCS